MHRRLTTLLRRLSPPDDPSSDAALLHRFVQQRDQTAFELLVWRHGGLVLGVCRRILRNDHAAEDAFQATFLILARRAGSVRGSLAGWLHQVARRVCWRVRKRNPVPVEPGSEVGANTPDPLLTAELRAVLDEEIARLPEKQRLAVVLCYLQGRTTDDAAKLLGIPRGTVLSRLDAARKRLRHTLTGRGVTVPATLLTGSLAAPELTAEGCRTTAETAVGFLTSPAITSIPTQLAHEVMQMTARKTMLGVAAVLVLTAGVGTGVGLVMAQGGKTPATRATAKPVEGQKEEPAKAEQKKDEDLKAKLRAQRLDELQFSQHRVSRQIEELEMQRLKAITATGGDVDPGILQAKLGEIDKQILTIEEVLAELPSDIKSEEKLLTEVQAGRFPNEDGIQKEVARIVRNRGEIQQAQNNLEQRVMALSETKRRVLPDSETVKELEKLLKAAEADFKQAEDRVQKREDKVYREQMVKNVEQRLSSQQRNLTSKTQELKSLRQKRVDLVVRIQKAKTAQNAQQLIDDEIQVLRDIRKQVMRERLMMEMGLEDKQK